MRLSSTLCVLALAPLLAACVGEVITTPISPADLVTTGKQLHGIVGYRAIQVIEVSTLTQFSADQKPFTTDCGRTPTQKIVSVPDQQHPLLLTYNHGILEGYTFGVTMAAHESPRTTKLYDRTKDRLTQDEVERIGFRDSQLLGGKIINQELESRSRP